MVGLVHETISSSSLTSNSSTASTRKVDVRLPGKGNSKLSWREAGPLDHLDDTVDSDQ